MDPLLFLSSCRLHLWMVVKKPESVWKKAEVWGFDTEGMI